MNSEAVRKIFSRNLRREVEDANLNWGKVQEFRLRIGQPMTALCGNEEVIFSKVVTEQELKETMDYVSNYSLYAYENEMKQGFLTIEGGHRVGVAGQVLLEKGTVKNLRQISSVNIRVSHEVMDCATPLFPYVTYNKRLFHTLIISPPGCGKTTLLRDMIRQISDGNRWVKGCTVGVVDERSELAGCYHGIPQNHMGMRTDVLDGCPKAEGMLMLIRSMAPRVIAVDELGMAEDIEALKYAMHCGCKILATAHGDSLEELVEKPLFASLIREGYFERYIVLDNRNKVGTIRGVYDRKGNLLYV